MPSERSNCILVGIPAFFWSSAPLMSPLSQVLTVARGNDYSGAGYTVCPYCFNNPPAEHGGDGQSQFRCFMCSAACPLAKRVQGGGGGGGGGQVLGLSTPSC